MAENVFAVTQSVSGKSLPTVARCQVKGATLSYRADAFEVVDDVYVSSGRCLTGDDGRHRLAGLLRQSVLGRSLATRN
jgi:hypothetical protein